MDEEVGAYPSSAPLRFNYESRLATPFGFLGLDERSIFAEFEGLVGGGGRKQMHRAGDDAGPPSLVVCAEAGAVVAVEVFVELETIAPVRIFLELLLASVHRSATVLPLKEHAAQAARDFLGD